MAIWKFELDLSNEENLPLSTRIARAISADIRRGRLRAGSALPGTRTLGESLGFSRSTVSAAYDELVAEGWLTTAGPRGTFVSETLPDVRPVPPSTRRASGARERLGFELRAASRSPLLVPAQRGRLVQWDFGIPDVRIAPLDALGRAYRRALRGHGAELLQYDRYARPGDSPLQVQLATMRHRPARST